MSDNNPAAPVDGPTPDLVRFRWSFEGMLPAPKGYQPGFVRGSDYDAATTAARTEAERARKQRDQFLTAIKKLHAAASVIESDDELTLALADAERLIAGDKTE